MGSAIRNSLVLGAFAVMFVAWPAPARAQSQAPQPVIHAVTPQGQSSLRTIRIEGENFGTRAANVRVRFGWWPAELESWSPTHLEVRVPKLAPGRYDLAVQVGRAASDRHPFVVTPWVAEVQVHWELHPIEVTLRGTGFGPQQGARKLTAAGNDLEILSWTEDSVRFRPSAAVSPGWNNVYFEVDGHDGLIAQFPVNPRVDRIAGGAVGSGAEVELHGMNFGADAQERAVLLGDVPLELKEWSDRRILATAPRTVPHGHKLLQVWVGGVPSNALHVRLRPTIERVQPEQTVFGTPITIYGANFGDAVAKTSVTFDGRRGRVLNSTGDTITALIPRSVGGGPAQLVVIIDGQASEPLPIVVYLPKPPDTRWEQPEFLDENW
jgi:hypothetical protein